jgi:hypothetical protein
MMRKTFLRFRKPQKWLGPFLLSFSLSSPLAQITVSPIAVWGLHPVNAQNLRPEQAAEIIYEQLPYLPQENQYISVETREIDPEHTLISRFIRYHKDFKRRSTQYSLDWKVTLADYLGVNQSIKESDYPGSSTLQTNPIEQDIEIIRQLSRRQRQQLVDLLVEVYKPKVQETTTQPLPEETEDTSDISTPSNPSLSRPGDAQLLAP